LFSSFKMRGAPPKVYQYYRQTDSNEKAILEDLYNSYDGLIKSTEESMIKAGMHKLVRNEEFGPMILLTAHKGLVKYGTSKGHPEFLISLFYEYKKIGF
jgi:hypothetical protein